MFKENSNLSTSAQSRVEKLIFSGGGTNGLQLVGAILTLDKMGAWQDIREVWGTSAGGIAAMLVAIGMSPEEIVAEVRKMDFKRFMDKSTPYWLENIGIKNLDIFGFDKFADSPLVKIFKYKQNGVFKGDAFAEYAKILLARKTGNPNITFAELHDAATNKNSPKYDPRYKDIGLTGTKIDPTPAELRLFNWHDTPDMPIWLGVRITMSYPGAFKTVEYNGEIFVDGALKNNLPIKPAIDFEFRLKKEADYFMNRSLHVRNNASDGIVGISMESIATIEAVQGLRRKANLDKEDTALDFLHKLAMASLTNVELLKEYKNQIIMPHNAEASNLNFEMTEEVKTKLFKEGVRAAEEFFQARTDFSDYQSYHNNHDIEYIVLQWKNYNGLIGNAISVDDKRNLENRFASYALDFKGSEQDYRKKLAEIFLQKQQAYKQAVLLADNRMKKNEEAARLILMHTDENLFLVGRVLQEFETQKQTYDMLIQQSVILVEINKMTLNLLALENNPVFLQAFTELRDNILDLSQHRFADQSMFKSLTAKAQAKLTAKLTELNFTAELLTKFCQALIMYAKYLQDYPERILPFLLAGNDLPEFHRKLQQITATIQVETVIFKQNLQQLEISSYKNGMLILHPELQEEIESAGTDNFTVAQLKAKYQDLQQQHKTSRKLGDVAAINNSIKPKHYLTIVLAKEAVVASIKDSNNMAINFVDLLQDACELYSQAFHFITPLEPEISKDNVNTICEMHELLKFLQKKTRSNIYISEQDAINQNYILAIEDMNRKSNIKDMYGSGANKHLNKLLDKITRHYNARKKGKE